MANSLNGSDDLGRSAREAADTASRQISETEARMRHQAARGRARGRDVAERLRRATDADSDLILYARDHPLQATGLAFVAGVLVASLIRR